MAAPLSFYNYIEREKKDGATQKKRKNSLENNKIYVI
jgi:hypothetical protein